MYWFASSNFLFFLQLATHNLSTVFCFPLYFLPFFALSAILKYSFFHKPRVYPLSSERLTQFFVSRLRFRWFSPFVSCYLSFFISLLESLSSPVLQHMKQHCHWSSNTCRTCSVYFLTCIYRSFNTIILYPLSFFHKPLFIHNKFHSILYFLYFYIRTFSPK